MKGAMIRRTYGRNGNVAIFEAMGLRRDVALFAHSLRPTAASAEPGCLYSGSSYAWTGDLHAAMCVLSWRYIRRTARSCSRGRRLHCELGQTAAVGTLFQDQEHDASRQRRKADLPTNV